MIYNNLFIVVNVYNYFNLKTNEINIMTESQELKLFGKERRKADRRQNSLSATIDGFSVQPYLIVSLVIMTCSVIKNLG